MYTKSNEVTVTGKFGGQNYVCTCGLFPFSELIKKKTNFKGQKAKFVKK
jgi:hypothetical protein